MVEWSGRKKKEVEREKNEEKEEDFVCFFKLKREGKADLNFGVWSQRANEKIHSTTVIQFCHQSKVIIRDREVVFVYLFVCLFVCFYIISRDCCLTIAHSSLFL